MCAHYLKHRQGAIATINFGNERLETKPGWESGSATIWGDQHIIDIEDSFDFLEIALTPFFRKRGNFVHDLSSK